MKLILQKFIKMDIKIKKLVINGLKFCLMLMLLACFILVKNQEIHNLNMFYIGFSLAKSALFFIVFIIICALAIDVIKDDRTNNKNL